MTSEERLVALDSLNLFFAIASKRGMRWEIFINGPDDITRPLHPINPRFWRRSAAERICSAFNSSVQTSAWIALDYESSCDLERMGAA